MMGKDKLRKFRINGSDEATSRFWDAVHHYGNYSQSRVSPVESSGGKGNDYSVSVRESSMVIFESLVKASGLGIIGIDNDIGQSSIQDFMDFMMGFLQLGEPRNGVEIKQMHDGRYIASVEFKSINGDVLNHAQFHIPDGVEQTAMREDNDRILLVFKYVP